MANGAFGTSPATRFNRRKAVVYALGPEMKRISAVYARQGKPVNYDRLWRSIFRPEWQGHGAHP